jgi:hypothetical protein
MLKRLFAWIGSLMRRRTYVDDPVSTLAWNRRPKQPAVIARPSYVPPPPPPPPPPGTNYAPLLLLLLEDA